MVFALSASAMAQETQSTETDGRLTLELNSIETQDNQSCRMTFVAHNALDAGLDAAGFEVVLFDGNGLVNRMTVFDFGALTSGKTLVKRFDVPETDCASLSRILVNGVVRCEGSGIDAGQCSSALQTRNKTEITFGS